MFCAQKHITDKQREFLITLTNNDVPLNFAESHAIEYVLNLADGKYLVDVPISVVLNDVRDKYKNYLKTKPGQI